MTETEHTREVVDAYTNAWIREDFTGAGNYLSEDLEFRGSIDRFDCASQFIEALQSFRSLLINVNILARLYDGNEAALLYDCVTNTNAGSIRTAEFFHTNGNKIDRIRLVFDATLLRPLMAGIK